MQLTSARSLLTLQHQGVTFSLFVTIIIISVINIPIIILYIRRIADAVRTKIEKFKVHLFVLGQPLSLHCITLHLTLISLALVRQVQQRQ